MPICEQCVTEKDFDDEEFTQCEDCDPDGNSGEARSCEGCGYDVDQCECEDDRAVDD